MKEVFLYNKGRHTLHIKGYCHYTKGKTDYIQFNSENEALAYDGRSVGMCKVCQKKREKALLLLSTKYPASIKACA